MILAVVYTFARIVFGVKIEGSLPGFIAVCAAFGLMTSTYGLLIAALSRTPQAARGLSVLATLLMVMLSVAWIPSFLFPGWLQQATTTGAGRFAVLFGTVAVLRFRWEADV